MLHRPPTRTYTRHALEAWLKHLAQDWEQGFSPEALARGRRFYKEAQVKALDIETTSLVVQSKMEDRKAPLIYCVVDYAAEGGLTVRTSIEDEALGAALAVAGLYELEEFLTTEENSILAEKQAALEAKQEAAKKTPNAAILPVAVKAPLSPGRTMVLSFSLVPKGIAFMPRWAGEVQGIHGGAGLTHPKEREDWIRLAHWARRSGFVYHEKTGQQVLANVPMEAVVRFLTGPLYQWRHHYKIDLPESVRRLSRGRQSLKLITAVTRAEGGIHVRPLLQLRGNIVPTIDLKALLKQGGEGVLEDYGWVSLSDEAKHLLDDWQSAFDGQWEGVWPAYMLFSTFVKGGEGHVATPEVQAWEAAFKQVALAEETRQLPAFLRSYQAEGVRWLLRLFETGGHALLADEMGLGKTLQVLSLLNADPLKGLEDRPHLVVCPASVVPVWHSEAARFFPHLTLRTLGRGTTFADHPGPCLWVASYTQLRRNRAELADLSFGYAILDEAQAIKNPHSKTAQAVFTLKAERRLALTGTPIENRHLDLWSVLRFLMPGLLGTRKAFEGRLMQEGGVASLRAQLSPFILRRMKRDVLKELPEKTEVTLSCPLTPVQRHLYKQLAEQGKLTYGSGFGDAKTRMNVLSILTRLRQTVCDPALLPEAPVYPFSDSGKLSVLLERVMELVDNGEKVVIFSQFVKLLNRVRAMFKEALPEATCYELTGSTIDRSEPVKGFQDHEGAALMLASLRAAGAGITLHAASYVFLLDPWWNPAVEAQAVDRVHRMGQKKPVFVYRLVSPGTLEEKIQALKAHKQGLFDDVLEDLPDLMRLEAHFKTLGELVDLNEESAD